MMVAQTIKNLPTIQETQVWSPCWEDPLEKEMATHSIFLPGEVHGQRSLVGYRSWGHKEWHNTEGGKKNHHHASSVLFHLFQLKLYTHLTFLSPMQNLQKNTINIFCLYDFDSSSSVQFSSSVVSDFLQPHGLQHARLPCPPAPGDWSNSCPSSQWCHPTISSCHPLLLPLIFPSIRVFSNESILPITWPKYWTFSFSISPSWIFRTDFL